MQHGREVASYPKEPRVNRFMNLLDYMNFPLHKPQTIYEQNERSAVYLRKMEHRMRKTELSKEELIQQVYTFFPREIYDSDSQYKLSPEWKKREAVYLEKWQNQESWLRILTNLRRLLPGSWVVDETVPQQILSYRCQLYPKEVSEYRLPKYNTVVGFISYLARYTVGSLYSEQVDDKRYKVEKLSHTFPLDNIMYVQQFMDVIEAELHYSFLSLERTLEKVPDVAVGNHLMGEAKLFHYLFDAHESL